jgi:hypothetical protein
MHNERQRPNFAVSLCAQAAAEAAPSTILIGFFGMQRLENQHDLSALLYCNKFIIDDRHDDRHN